MISQSVARGNPAVTQTAVKRHGSGILGISAMEIRKLIRRPMTWVIFGLPAALGAAWFPIAYLISRAQGSLASLGPHLFPPGYIENTFAVLTMLGTICVAVLAASVVGSEYGWGTIRVLIGTGTPRARLLGGKVVALAVAVAAWIVTSFAAITLSSIVVTALSGHPVSFGNTDAAWFGQLGLMFGRTWLVLEAWLAIAVAASVVGRSLAAGIAVPIVWQVVETVLSAVAPLAGNLGTRISELLIAVSARTFEIHDTFGTPRLVPGAISETQALLVLAGYVVVMLALAFLVFVRRDYTASA